MGHWHYQVMKHTEENEADGSIYVWYGVHEFYPLDDGPVWTQEPVTVEGESIEDLKWQLKAILGDIEKHGVIDYG